VLPDDADLVSVMQAFDVSASDYLGHGGEAWVFALGDERVLRVLHAGSTVESVVRIADLVTELRRSSLPFALPEVLDAGDLDGRVYAIERRLPGHSLMLELSTANGSTRSGLIEAYLNAASVLGNLRLNERGYFGDLLADEPIRTSSWLEYLRARAVHNRSRSVPELAALDFNDDAFGLPEPEAGSFVHLDAFAGNMLTDGAVITAVIDVGVSSVVGDRRLDPLAAAVYLLAPDITPAVRESDEKVVHAWLHRAGLRDLLEPACMWLASYWSFAIDDPSVMRWCRTVLRA